MTSTSTTSEVALGAELIRLTFTGSARATNVEVHFRTTADGEQPVHASGSLPDLRTHNISSIMVRNDGLIFRNEDWSRLRTIAEGQPDETKIGAFGACPLRSIEAKD